jgi:hypothetical protein
MSEFKDIIIQEGFGALDLSQKDQVETAVDYFDNLDDLIDMLKAKRTKLSDMIKQVEMRKERFKQYILDYMDQHNVEDLEGTAMRFRASRSQPKLLVDEDKLDKKFLKQEIIFSADKERIADALNLGEDVVGAKYEASKQLRVYTLKADKKGSKK